MSANPTSLSVIVPAYNEAGRIGSSLSAVGAYLENQGYASEIILVDDGSSDGTCDVVREISGLLAVPVRVLRCERNRGKGYALKVGFAASRGERVLFTDADLSTPIETSERLLESLARGCDLAIGSRKLEESRIAVRQPWYRERMGTLFTVIVRHLISDVSDVTCGFKAFRGEVGRDLFSRVRIHDWSFDAEVLWIARERGYKLDEVPVEWEDRAGTKVRLLRDAVKALIGLARILINAAAGRYREPTEAAPFTEVRTPSGPAPRGEGGAVDPGSTP